jgi:hypothetical protein
MTYCSIAKNHSPSLTWLWPVRLLYNLSCAAGPHFPTLFYPSCLLTWLCSIWRPCRWRRRPCIFYNGYKRIMGPRVRQGIPCLFSEDQRLKNCGLLQGVSSEIADNKGVNRPKTTWYQRPRRQKTNRQLTPDSLKLKSGHNTKQNLWCNPSVFCLILLLLFSTRVFRGFLLRAASRLPPGKRQMYLDTDSRPGLAGAL